MKLVGYEDVEARSHEALASLVVHTRQIGFDSNDTYKAIVTTPYETNGAMKFWK